ncbi:MAG: hypothetical protein IAF94_04605 [Pirellulaceae bacterium]|nr:hypothetical protein [Pirellulaceae bacterium]
MPWRRVIPIVLLFALAAVLAGANTWFTAARGTIPLTLDTKVMGKEVRREKHEGKDDVCLLLLEGLGQIQVGREIFESVAVGETLQKERQSHELRHGDQIMPLHWSRDHQGMMKAMPICLAILAALVASALLVRPRAEVSIDKFPR